jgi:hypothetical protein
MLALKTQIKILEYINQRDLKFTHLYLLRILTLRLASQLYIYRDYRNTYRNICQNTQLLASQLDK